VAVLSRYRVRSVYIIQKIPGTSTEATGFRLWSLSPLRCCSIKRSIVLPSKKPELAKPRLPKPPVGTLRRVNPGTRRQAAPKTLAWTIKNFVRYKPLEGAFENVLALPLAIFMARGSPSAHSTNDIQHRHAHFEAARHRGAVDLCQNVTRKPGLQIYV